MPARITAAMCAAGRALGDAALSPDGALVAFVASEGGRARIVVVEAGGGPERTVSTVPSPPSARAGGSGVLAWVPEGDALLYVAAEGGVWRQPVAGGPPTCVWVGEGRTVAAPAAGPGGRVALVVDAATIVAVVDGQATTTWSDHDFCADPVWSPDGAWLSWTAWDVPAMPWDDAVVLLAPADGSAPPRVVAGGRGSAAQQPRFSPDGSRLAFLDDADGWLNLTVVPLAGAGEARVLAEPHEHGGPAWGPGQRSFAWSPDGEELVVTRNEGGYQTLLRWRPGQEPTAIGRGIHGCLSWRGDRVAAVRSGARTPTQVAVYDLGEGARRAVATGPVAGFDDGVEPEMVRWPSEGVEVPGRLYRGAGTGLLVWVHGGPTDQWLVEFRARFAFWLDRGWSILVPDHRGSTGHGRAFAQALRGRWGEADVADVAAGVRAATAAGWGAPDRVVAMGASAGGFTVLNLLARHPGLVAAGVSLYGIADLATLETHRFEAHYNLSLVGPYSEPLYRERSPIARADAIVDPVLLLHGDADPVVPVAQSRELAARVATAELHVYEGEGHGWGRPEVVVDELTRTEEFLRRHVPERNAK